MKADFIPGIFNYCDRCCDHCSFTHRCSIFVGNNDNKHEEDMSNEQLISVISEKLRGLSELFAQRDAILSITSAISVDRSPEHVTEEEVTEAVIDNSSLISRSRHYGREATRWLNNHAFDHYLSDLYGKVELGVKDELQAADEISVLQEWVAEIQRFSAFIPAKLKRALYSAHTLKRWERHNGFQNDCDGSAKIALIAIDRSMDSWRKIMRDFPGLEDKCLSFLVALEQLKTATLREFPEALHFVRPGFDEQF